MTEIRKIYTDDLLVHYATTTIPPERTKMMIDGVLGEYQVIGVYWEFDMPHNNVWVMFKIKENIQGRDLTIPVKVVCPRIWDKAVSRGRNPHPETINWKISLRAMYWFIKTHLETAYAMQSGNIIAFLPYIQTGKETQVKDMILPELKQYAALEHQEPLKQNEDQTIEAEYTVKES